MEDIFDRNKLYFGDDFEAILKNINVAVFGLGGVGGYAVEALTRLGISNFTIVDFDVISKTNINRQIIALHSNIKNKKTSEFEKRLKDINPNIKLRIFDTFYDETLNDEIFKEKFDYVIDAIDTNKSKIDLIKYCVLNNIKLISSFGAGNRIDGAKSRVLKIEDVIAIDSFSKNLISKLKKLDVLKKFYVVMSDEKPKKVEKIENVQRVKNYKNEEIELRKISPASNVCVVAIQGYLMANFVLCEEFKKHLK